METDRKWIVVRVDGKLAGISQDYGRLAEIAAGIDLEYKSHRKPKKGRSREEQQTLPYGEVTAQAVTFEEVMRLKASARWEDLMLFGTDFQKRVWKTLWDLSSLPAGHEDSRANEDAPENKARLLSYSDFADLCRNRAGVRAVAHAIALNPLPVVIPCHLIVPKEAIDRIREIQRKAEDTIFKGEDLCHTSILNDNAIDFGEYALGRELKRRLISMDLG